MLDSLVRVTRRVGWGADRIATDPTHMAWDDRRPRPPAVGEHCRAVLPSWNEWKRPRAHAAAGIPQPNSRTGMQRL